MKKFITLITLYTIIAPVFSQNVNNSNEIIWNSTNRLTQNDFNYRKCDSTHSALNATFMLGYYVPALSFKSMHKSIYNSMLKNGSWIDTSLNIEAQIKFWQNMFDINEIYTRQLRQKIFESANNVKAS